MAAMTRRRRRRHPVATAFLLSLCALPAVAWALSYCDGVYSSDGAIRILRLQPSQSGPAGPRYLWARSDHGRNVGVWYDLRRGQGGTPDSTGMLFLNSTPSSSWARLGFESHRGGATYQGRMDVEGGVTTAGTFNFHLLAVPYWAIVLPLSLAPVGYWAAALRRRRRRRRGLCPRCGYDLRASSGRCPECGLLIRRRPTVAVPQPAAAPEPAPAAAALESSTP